MLMTIYVGESDRQDHRPLYQAIVESLREKGVAGATATRGIEGFGRKSRIHISGILRMSEDLPVVISAVDGREKIEEVLPLIDSMVSEGLVTLQEVRSFHYSPE